MSRSVSATTTTTSWSHVARDLIADGHSRLKMLVGVAKDGHRGDIRRVRHVRDAIGDDIILAIDANESISISTRRSALRAASRIATSAGSKIPSSATTPATWRICAG